MSCYVVSDKTISVIAKAFVIYGVDFKDKSYQLDDFDLILVNGRFPKIGKCLLRQNLLSYYARYQDEKTLKHIDEEVEKFKYEDVELNPGLIYGCIECYDYQACETKGYETSQIHYSLMRLKDKVARKFIEQNGYEIPWGVN